MSFELRIDSIVYGVYRWIFIIGITIVVSNMFYLLSLLFRRIKRVASPRRGNRMQIVPMNVGRMILDGLDVSDEEGDMMSSSRHDDSEHDRHSPGTSKVY